MYRQKQKTDMENAEINVKGDNLWSELYWQITDVINPGDKSFRKPVSGRPEEF